MELPEATKIRLQSQHLSIEDLVQRLTEDEYNREIIPGKWTVHQQLAHLVRYQEMFFERVQMIMNSFNAVFDPYVAEEDVQFPKVTQLPVSELLVKLREMRKIISDFYLGLNSGELVRKGKHTQLGNFSIALWAEFFLLHEAHHLFEIFRMTSQLRADTDAKHNTH